MIIVYQTFKTSLKDILKLNQLQKYIKFETWKLAKILFLQYQQQYRTTLYWLFTITSVQ